MTIEKLEISRKGPTGMWVTASITPINSRRHLTACIEDNQRTAGPIDEIVVWGAPAAGILYRGSVEGLKGKRL
jgi:hypothetical protein